MKAPLLLSSLLVLLSLVVVLHVTWGLPAVLLLLAAAALSGVIALVWGSLTRLAGDGDMSLEEALSLAAPTVEEEQKRAILRALKDLEYELFVGKISRQDYDELSTHYRAEARRLIAQADESLGERRELAEQRLQAALRDQTTLSLKKGKRGNRKRGRNGLRSELSTTSPEAPSAREKAKSTSSDGLNRKEIPEEQEPDSSDPDRSERQTPSRGTKNEEEQA